MSWESFTRYLSGNFIDHVYANNQVVRIDKSAAQQTDLLSSYTFDDPVIWAGSTTAYKLYENTTISVYCSGTVPLSLSNCPHEGADESYGIKIDTVTNTRMYKVQDWTYEGSMDCAVYTYDSSGNRIGKDWYIACSVTKAKEIATKYSLSFPCPESVENDAWCWGVYGEATDTGGWRPSLMKAYVAVE